MSGIYWDWGIIWYLPPIKGTRKLHWNKGWLLCSSRSFSGGANGSCPCHGTTRRSSPSTQWSLGMHVWLSQSAYATWHVSQWMRWGVKGGSLMVRWWSKHFMHSIYFLKISGETCLDNSCAKHSESRKSLRIEGHSVNCVPFWSCLLSCFPILGLGFPWRFSCKDFLGGKKTWKQVFEEHPLWRHRPGFNFSAERENEHKCHHVPPHCGENPAHDGYLG